MKYIFSVVLFMEVFAASAQWLQRDTLKEKRQEMPAVLLGNKIYINGGIAPSGVTLTTTEVYDVATGKWSGGVDLPLSRHHHSMTVLNNEIWVIGGYLNVLFQPQTNVWKFDSVTQQWLVQKPLPIPIGAGDAVTYQGKIYHFGGKSINNQVLDRTYMYNPADTQWRELSPMSVPREHLSAAVIDSLIYVVAGRGSNGADVALEVYNPRTDTWQTKANLPTARSGGDAVAYKGRLHFFGGEGNGVFDAHEVYHPLTNAWSSFPPLPHARHGLACVVVADSLYALAGAIQPNLGPSNLNEVFQLNLFTALTEPNTHSIAKFYYDKSASKLFVFNATENTALSIYNLQGSKMKESKIENPTALLSLSLPPGIYIIAHGNQRVKFVVER